MAWSPATPAPTTKTRAAARVPAAVIIMGKQLGQRVGPEQHGLVAGDGGHGREDVHALGAGDPRHHLHGEEGRPGCGDRLVGIVFGERFTDTDHHLPRPRPFEIGLPLFGVGAEGADLQDHIRPLPDIGAVGRQGRALFGVGRVVVAGRGARAGLDEHLEFGPGQLLDTHRNEGDARLTREGLFDNSYDHR